MKKKRTLKIVSLILAIVMAISIMPLAALAGESQIETKQKVAVVVYSAQFTQAVKTVLESDQPTPEELKTTLEDLVANGLEGLKVPQVELSLTSEDEPGLDPITMQEAENFNLFKSLKIESSLLAELNKAVDGNPISGSFVDELKENVKTTAKTYVDTFMENMFGKFQIYGSMYRVYTAEVPATEAGTNYTLKVEKFNKNNDPDVIQAGYILCDEEGSRFKSDRIYHETICYTGKDDYQFLGNQNAGLYFDLNPFNAIQEWVDAKAEENELWKLSKKIINGFLDTINKAISDKSKVNFIFPGLWCAESKAGFEFMNTDLVDNPLMKSDFLMVDRDEVVNVLKFVVDLGKDAFVELMKAAFGDEYAGTYGEQEYDNLVVLHTQLINSDEEGQMSISQDALFEIVKVYLGIASNLEIFQRVKDADLVLPAILEASADENGIVTFNRDSNITLVWGLKVIKQIIEKSPDLIDQADSIPAVYKTLYKYIAKLFTDGTELTTSFVNGLPYSIAQAAGLVGPKMQDDHYIMLQIKAPTDAEGGAYMLNPLAYTMDVTWKNENWAYVTLADLGIITPYVAEGLYDFVRNTTFEGTVDAFLAKVTRQDDKFVTRALTGDLDVTAALTAYITANVYGPLGLDNVFANKSEFLDGLNEYLYNNGRTTQNLMVYLNKQAKKAKAVYAGNLNPLDEEGNPLLDANGERVYWQFYNVDKSLTIVATKLIKKSADDLAGLIAGDNKVSETKKDVISKTGSTVATIVEKVGTRIEATTAKVTSQIASAAKSVASKLFSSAVSSVKTVVTSLFSNIGKLFSKSMITFNA